MRRAALAVGLLCLARAAAAAPAPGLLAEYADGKRRVAEVVATPSFSLRAGESIHPSVAPAFAAAWTGSLKILVPGKYRFSAAPAKLTVAGQAVGDAPVELKPGLHPLRLEYRRTAGDARLQPTWSSEVFGPEPIPPAAFVHEPSKAVEPWASVDRGRALVHDLNCAGCHGGAPQDRSAHGRGPILSNAGGRTTAAWLYHWLGNPAAYRRAARMPVLPLSETERRDVAAFLATVQQRGYMPAGSIRPADEQQAAAERAKGKHLFESIGCTACHGDGPNQLSSPVGSKLSFGALRSFLLDPGRVDPTGRMPNMLLKDDEATAIAAFLMTKKLPAFEAPAPAGDPVAGRAVVERRGCLNCHTLEVKGVELVSTLKAAPMAALKPERGCLSAQPPGAAPRFRLTAPERADIAAYLVTPDVARSPIAEFRHGADFFRCRQCHDLGGAPAVTFKESPPSLVDTGNKLRVAWLREVLTERMRLRPWLELRMPSFGGGSAHMADGFAAVAGATRDDPPPAPKPTAEQTRQGIRYLGRGEEGLSCITCHDFGWFKPGAATPAPDMVSMHRRMRPEWFQRWLKDPARIQPGTQMPAFFADVDKGVAQMKIDAMWAALSLGRDMPLPEGVTPHAGAVKLPVGADPVVFRTFVTGGGERSIAVGFPGGQAFAFDAADCRLQFAWTGEFLDVRQVWMERGGQKAIPLGERWFIAPEGNPLRAGEGKPRFRGYVLEKRVPVFLYDVGGARVRDRIEPTPDGKGLVRTIEVKGARDVSYVPGATGVDVRVDKAGATKLIVTITPRKGEQAAAK